MQIRFLLRTTDSRKYIITRYLPFGVLNRKFPSIERFLYVSTCQPFSEEMLSSHWSTFSGTNYLTRNGIFGGRQRNTKKNSIHSLPEHR